MFSCDCHPDGDRANGYWDPDCFQYGEVLGVHMLGNPCSEIIYGACMAIEQEMTLKEMQEVVFPHPTVSEIFKETVFSFNE